MSLVAIDDLMMPYDADEMRQRFRAIESEHEQFRNSIGRAWLACEQREVFDWDIDLTGLHFPA